MSTRAERYTSVAIVLHWAIAFAIVFMLLLGFWMHEQAEDGNASQAVFDAYQLHKSVGFTILGLSLVRWAWRLLNPPPPMPPHMPAWERFAATATHWAFYALMIGLPLSGWLFVSAGWSIHDDAPLAVPTRWFDLVGIPHLFGLDRASADVRADAAEAAFTAHALMAWTIIGLAALHVVAALKHHFFDRDAVLAHMVPGLRAPGETEPAPKNAGRLAVLGFGAALIVSAAAALVFAVLPALTSPPLAPSTVEIVEAETPPAVEEIAPAEPGAPSAWRVDTRSSAIGFGYTYEDESGATDFNGRFTRWRADIRFDPDNLDTSNVVVTIEPASASTGIAAHDGALPGAEWFDAAAHPTATFSTTRIRANEGGGYEARGDLTIKGQTRSVDLPFRLTIDGDRAAMTGSLTIDRRDFGVGGGAADDLISREIRIDVRVDADRVR